MNKDKIRQRSAAYPFELPYRLINMFSIKGDMVLDPFLGIGTTTMAAMTAGRNSIGFEIEDAFRDAIASRMRTVVQISNQRIRERIKGHMEFVKARFEKKGAFKYRNKHYHFPVITRQETDLLLNRISSVEQGEKNMFNVICSEEPQKEFYHHWDDYIVSGTGASHEKKRKSKKAEKKPVQLRISG
ncbi:MAG: site-specific DNA-methyltransferase [Deltaproteobacteria bacterium]|nr:site-specific DNA-methyltransferase [Deltaproteobacteria bacterium]